VQRSFVDAGTGAGQRVERVRRTISATSAIHCSGVASGVTPCTHASSTRSSGDGTRTAWPWSVAVTASAHGSPATARCRGRQWQERYITDAWIAVPPEHAPSAAARAPLTDRLANDGYW
jgi:hypothetical protein